MAGYRVSPQGVDQTLARVRTETDGLRDALEEVWADAPGAAGGSQLVAAALGGFVEAAQDDIRAVADRLESAPGAMVRAVAAILEGDEEMARTHAQGLSRAESLPAVPLGPPSGMLGPPVPAPIGDGGSAYDPSRFGARQSLLQSESPLQPGEPLPTFDPQRFGGVQHGSGTGVDS